jgi:WD40 repeat protein
MIPNGNAAIASTSTEAATTKSILTPSITLKGHEKWIQSISYFPDGQRMISGSWDKTARQWDLNVGKEIQEAQDVCEEEVSAVAVSMDGRWVVTGGGDLGCSELKACEVETGIIKTFKGHSLRINCIDISPDNMLLASGADDWTARIWNLDTGKLVAGPFESIDYMGAVRFSPDSKKLAVESWVGKCLEVWDVRSQMLDARIGKFSYRGFTYSPIRWTNNNKNILAAFSFIPDDDARTIHEFDASTLATVRLPFEGHTERVISLALSFDGAFLASAGADDTVKLWAYQSRQLLASFDIPNLITLVLSPDSRQLVYSTYTENDYKIYICNTPDVVAQASVSKCSRKHSPWGRVLIDILHHYYSLTQLVVLLPGAADHPILIYLWCRDLRLQETRSNVLSFASTNCFASLLVQTQSLFDISNLVIS